jgi:ribosomal protein S2
MKKSLSKHKQDNIWYRKELPNRHIVKLRKNHKQVEKNFDGKKELYWVCDEVEVSIPKKENITKYVEENFEFLFEMFL